MQGKIQFNKTQASGLDSLAGAPELACNVITDVVGTVRRRPGVQLYSPFTATGATKVTGITPFKDGLIYAQEAQTVSKYTPPGLTDLLSPPALSGVDRPVFVVNRDTLYIASGGMPQKVEAGTLTGLSADAPDASHVVGIATRLVASVADDSGTIRWSGLFDSGHDDWDPLNYMEAEAKPDRLLALWENTNELFAFGAETLQVLVPDGNAFGFSPSRALNVGLLAPHSVVRVNDAFCFLDQRRRFVYTDGRSYTDVSSAALGDVLRKMAKVDDCWGFRLRTGPWDAVVWMFPTAGKGYIYDINNKGWSEWRERDGSGWGPVTITAACEWTDKGVVVVGLSDGTLGYLDHEAGDDAGNAIKVEMITGYQNHGTTEQKFCKSVSLVFRRGGAAVTASDVLRLHMRDDTGPWRFVKEVGFGSSSDRDPVVVIRGLGTYRERQWRIEYTGASPLNLVDAVEDFDVEEA